MKPGTKIIIEVLSDGTKSYNVSNANGDCTVHGQVRPGSLENVIKYAIEKVEETSHEEPKKKIIPFDLSLEEDRTALLGKRIVSKHDLVEKEDMLITRFFEWTDEDCGPEWVTDGVVNGSELLSNYVFYDTDKPVGKVFKE